MSTQHLYKPEEVELVRSKIATGFNLDSEHLWMDGNVIHSIKNGRRTKFPLKFNLRLHKDTSLEFLLKRAKTIFSSPALYDVTIEGYGLEEPYNNNQCTLTFEIGYDEFVRILKTR